MINHPETLMCPTCGYIADVRTTNTDEFGRISYQAWCHPCNRAFKMSGPMASKIKDEMTGGEYVFLESITKVEYTDNFGRGFKFRVWKDETQLLEIEEYEAKNLNYFTSMLLRFRTSGNSPTEIARYLAALPRVNAVEVVNSYGVGLVLYNNF